MFFVPSPPYCVFITHSIDVKIEELYCKLVIKTESPDVCWQAQSCDWIINILIIILLFCF